MVVLGFNESSGPKDRSSQDLSFCDEHHKRTCCEKNHTKQVRTAFAAFSHERSGRCAQLGRLAFCSLCDGDVGIGMKVSENLILLCPSFCKLWFQSCADDYFAPGTGGAGSVAPCGPSALVCSPLSEITQDPAAFCAGVGGFEVAEAEEGADEFCYDGVPAAKMKGKAPRAPWSPPKRKERTMWRRMMDEWYRSGIPYWVEENAPGIAIAIVAAAVAWCAPWFLNVKRLPDFPLRPFRT
ncbi:unnamed protein product [Effrenium voratum]|nr:unnamed protein product [Effrenium voratum]